MNESLKSLLKFAALVGVIAILFAVESAWYRVPAPTASTATASTPARPPIVLRPVTGWAVVKTSSLGVTQGEMKAFKLPVGKYKIDFAAESPISVGLVREESLNEFRQTRQLPEVLDFSGLGCAETGNFRSSVICEVPNNGEEAAFLIRDDRKLGSTLARGALSFWTHNAAPIEKQTAINKVDITLSMWRCISNCS